MNEELEYGRRARMRSLILLVVVLLVGMLLGAAEERYVIARAPREHTYPGALGRMKLTASQRTTIDSLIDLARPRFDSIVQRALPDLRAEADSLRAVVRTVLTPEQQRLFDSEPRPESRELLRRISQATAPASSADPPR